MLCGAAIGAQIGVVATKYVKGYGIRFVFGLAVIGCLISVVCKLVEAEFPACGSGKKYKKCCGASKS